jgi:hypothetical protein
MNVPLYQPSCDVWREVLGPARRCDHDNVWQTIDYRPRLMEAETALDAANYGGNLEPDGDRLKITLKGDLAGMLSAARDTRGRQKPATSCSK